MKMRTRKVRHNQKVIPQSWYLAFFFKDLENGINEYTFHRELVAKSVSFPSELSRSGMADTILERVKDGRAKTDN